MHSEQLKFVLLQHLMKQYYPFNCFKEALKQKSERYVKRKYQFIYCSTNF